MAGKLIIAAAGSGKTKLIVDDAIAKANRGIRVLITTYTDACEQEINERIISQCRYFPEQITVQSWWSFLLAHCVKPFQGSLFDHDVKGVVLINGKSGLRSYNAAGKPMYWGEKDFDKFYFSTDKRIYSDKLALLALRCDDESNGHVFSRISRCFQSIFIDEIQDFAGYDLEIIDRLLNSCNDVLLVGDPRQATYSTHSSSKHRQYKKAHIVNFFEDKSVNLTIDDTSLIVNYRCCQSICDTSNALYPDMRATRSGNEEITDHDGVFAILPEDVDQYLATYQPMQLRHSVSSAVNTEYPAINFGKSKGLTYERVLIYPTGPILSWLKDNGFALTQAGRSKFYVALTRARSSVGIIIDKTNLKKITALAQYHPEQNTKKGTDAAPKWQFEFHTLPQGFQGIAIQQKINGVTITIYGHISPTKHEAVSKTKELILKIGDRC